MNIKKAENLVKNHINDNLLGVAKKFIKNGFEIYIVGGFIRDILLSKYVFNKAFDLATNAAPGQVKSIFKKVIPTGIKHGTVTVIDEKKFYEITTFRCDGQYSDGRHPDNIKFAETIYEDLSRRDFTINAFAFDLNNFKLIDEYNGLEDLEKKIIRTIGNPDERFQEDGLRLIRAVRFAAVLNFKIEDRTFRSIKRNLFMLDKVAFERIKDEFIKISQSDKPSEGIELFRKLEILRKIIPELLTCYSIKQNKFHKYDVYYHLLYTMDAAPSNNLEVRLASLFHDISKPFTKVVKADKENASFYNHEIIGSIVSKKILKRLRFSNEIIDKVEKLVKFHMFFYTEEWTDSAVRRLLRNVGIDLLDDLFLLREADRIGNGTKHEKSKHLELLKVRIKKILDEENAFSLKHLNINGLDVMKIKNLEPSPKIGEILNYLLEKVIEDPSLNEDNKLKEMVKDYNE